jgi:hypothetical protein
LLSHFALQLNGCHSGDRNTCFGRASLFGDTKLHFKSLTEAIERDYRPLVLADCARRKIPAIDDGGDAQTHRPEPFFKARLDVPENHIRYFRDGVENFIVDRTVLGHHQLGSNAARA